MVSEQFTVGHATFELQLVSPRNRRPPGAPIDVSSPAKSEQDGANLCVVRKDDGRLPAQVDITACFKHRLRTPAQGAHKEYGGGLRLNRLYAPKWTAKSFDG